MIKLIGLVPLFPLIGFLINGFFGKKVSKSLSGIIASVSILASFVLSVLIFVELNGSINKSHVVNLFSWINSGTLQIPFEFLVDPLSSLFLLIITGIGFLIHVYSIGYMSHDAGFARFFTYLNLFVFFMLLLVLGNNYLIMFVGWEGVGLCSYLLIGFWFKNNAYNDAARKAFVMNRIGDLGFLLGIILIFVTFGSISYNEVFLKAGTVSTGVITSIALLLFIGAMGKSAQIPLYTWLPDAMAGPTPVSALIHAATMVTAGIYMIVRSNIFYSISEVASETVAIVGVLTALFAATIGLFQNDIKKILAYSTVSQLGFMFLALGVGAYSSAVFHVTTHAFFKALLFLGAGSVIHAMGGEQDIRKMGGLSGKIKITFVTMLLGTVAISGLPPFSGFFSKDEILAHAYEHNPVLWMFGSIASMLTAFYMFRLLFLTFFGKFRGTHEQEHHLHESPSSMTFPLIVLAILSVAGGLLGLPEFWHLPNWMSNNLESVIIRKSPSTLHHETEWMLMGIAVLAALATIYFAYIVYRQKKTLPIKEGDKMPGLQTVIYNKYYVDEIYDALIRKPLDVLSVVFHKFFDIQIIDGLVNGVGSFVKSLGSAIRLLQNGNIGFYITSMVIGIVFIILLTFLI
ncbi:NADH-quinone oxidoreductase subunit L [Sediminibacterium sp.]|uniref:NADH-quinone oxidoreductase subunit L n=1 Tax=Sediminibacterium sp. TaxID=1917865 RepID=UPI002733A8FB|nr:NADH-quinone oxidoreductase subunit L [Sediminibacterium sp.]MDP3567629.1 NADH-quinone oxidoreductase subunit L [Sediminibacterium sp.]